MRKVRRSSPFHHAGRITFLRLMGMAVFGLVLVKLTLVQVLWRDRLDTAFEQQLHKQRELKAPRGSITDSRGNPLAVELLHYYELELNPRQIRDAEALASRIQPASGMSRAKLDALLARELKREPRRSYLRLARQVPEPLIRPFRDELIRGLYLTRTGMRIYPQGQVAGNLLGILNHEGIPIGGLESCYDGLLAGSDGFDYVIKTAGGREHSLATRSGKAPVPGADLELFLDLRYQTIAEEELAGAVEHWQALSGQVVLLDPEEGSLLALASWPPLDPNDRAGYTTNAARIRCVSDMYEPGSTFKLVSFAALLEEGVITDLEERVPCYKGSYRVANRVIHDSEKDGYDTLSVTDVFSLSSNIGTVVLAERMERDALFVMSRNFGMGQPLGLDLPGESGGLLLPLDRWGPVEYANITMGQGVATTALQMACAFGAVANDGVLVRPRLLDRISDMEGERATERVEIRRVMSRRSARILQDLMRTTVADGTGKLADSDRVAISGKTGTAQKVQPEGGYSRTDYIASFGGFADVDGRRMAGLVILDSPRGSVYGGTVAAPVFRNIMERISCVDVDHRVPLEPIQWSGKPGKAGIALPAGDEQLAAQVAEDRLLVEARP